MNKRETQDAALEQALRVHYRARFAERQGLAPTSAETYWSIAAQLKPGVSPQSRWYRLFLVGPLAKLFTGPTARPAPRRRLALAGVLACVLLLISGAAYAMSAGLIDQLLSSSGTSQLDYTNVHMVRTAGSFTVHMEKVYADVNNVLIAYTISHTGNAIAIALEPSLKTSDGIQLSYAAGFNASEAADPQFKKSGQLLDFDASPITGAPRLLHLKLHVMLTGVKMASSPGVVSVPPRQGATIQESSSVAFDFTVPFHPGRVVKVNKTVTSSGYALTLDHVVITPSGVRAYFKDIPSGKIALEASLQIAGQSYQGYTTDTSYNQFTREEALNFAHVMLHPTGTWTLKVSRVYTPSGDISGDWQITFPAA